MLYLLWISSMAKTLLNFIPRREGSLRRRSPSCHHRHRQAKRERRGGGFAYASKMLSPLSSVRPSPPNGEPTQKGKTQNSNSKKNLASPAKKFKGTSQITTSSYSGKKGEGRTKILKTIKVDAKVKCVKEIISPSFEGVSSFVKK